MFPVDSGDYPVGLHTTVRSQEHLPCSKPINQTMKLIMQSSDAVVTSYKRPFVRITWPCSRMTSKDWKIINHFLNRYAKITYPINNESKKEFEKPWT